jgi:furin
MKISKQYLHKQKSNNYKLADRTSIAGVTTLNVQAAWNEGYTGKGVSVVVVDDGLEWHHPEIIDSYDPKISTDLNDDDSDPSPRYDDDNSNKQGTNLAGIIVSKADNFYCGVGVAQGAKIGGVRVLDGNITDRLESKALSFQKDFVDIYNAGWGPDDNGKTVDGPGPLTRNTLEEGAKNGRNGKGSIFVWASGTGGKSMDNCNCDGYASSIYTIAIGSVSADGSFPWYAEQCSASLAVTFSNGVKNEPSLVTSTLYGKCKVVILKLFFMLKLPTECRRRL